jgi:hypothetical protein
MAALLLELLEGLIGEKSQIAVRILQVFGAVMVVLAFLTGYFASSFASKTFLIPEDDIALHHRVGKAVLVGALLLPALGFMKPYVVKMQMGFKVLYWVVFLALIGVLVLVGYFGAYLVFIDGAGVIGAPRL